MPNVGQEASTVEGQVSRERIFQAIISITLRDGFGKVTLSLVAREAGFSKGGLLYHFATKNDLIRAMLEHYADPTTGGSELAQAEGSSSSTYELDPFAVAVLVAAAENPTLLEPFGEFLQPVEIRTSASLALTQRSLSLLGNLANRLCLGAPRSSDWRKGAGTAA